MTSRFSDPDKTGYFVEDGAIRRFTTYSGVRYVHPLSMGVSRVPNTIGSCQAKVSRPVRDASMPCEH